MVFPATASLIYFLFMISEIPHSFAQYDPERTIEFNGKMYTEENLKTNYGEVVFSTMLFRHGARERVFKYPKGENEDYYNERGWGLLTQTGKTQIYELGKWARARYIKLLKNTPYVPGVIHVQSTVSDRTIASAQIFLTGFYPPTTEQEKWNDDFNWQPIPVYSTPKEMDKSLLFEKYCSRYNLEMLRVNNDPTILEYYKKYKHVFDILKNEAGAKFEDGDIATAINEVVHLRDSLFVDARNKLKLPDWSVNIYPGYLDEMSKMFFKVQTFNHEMKRLKGGPFVKNIRDDMIRRRDDYTSEKRFQLYSGHDTTIAVLLNTLGVFDNEHPLYGATVLVELREKLENEGVKQYYVIILYKKTEGSGLKQLEMSNCPNPCTLESFVEATKELIPDNWEAECENLKPDYNTILF